MKSLIKNYINKLTKEKLDKFAKKNDIFLSDNELNYLLNLVKDNIDDLLQDEGRYISEVKNNISKENFDKIFKLYTYYKNRYKGYLF